MNDPSVKLILHIILWLRVHHMMRTFYRLEVKTYPNITSRVHITKEKKAETLQKQTDEILTLPLEFSYY